MSSQKLRKYLLKCKQVTVDETILHDLRREMEQAVPEIAESIRQREALAAKLRLAAGKKSETRKD